MTIGLVPLEGGYEPPGLKDFDWPGIVPGAPDWLDKPFMQAALAFVLVLLFWLIGTRKLSVRPGKKQFFFESVYEFVRNGIARDILHAEYRKFLPYLLTLFTFILFSNWFGQFFLLMYPTFSNIGFAYGFAIISWFVYVGAGIAKWGFGPFMKKSLIPEGVPGYLLPLIMPLEFLSNFITRPVTLALRVFATMFAGHLVVMVFIVGGGFLLAYQDNLFYNVSGGASFLFGLLVMALELFIGALQAYIFTVLTAQYLSTSIAEAH
ncbi:F0F1 ATP synthase subunit A [uncultured Tessaracoccus sp.]|uniref:F0F1 ATP synthase subunit A n=1 Tax=uncultured Tessaracoccus sp. TaxID=905023 RepID=UPI0025E18199|nr:F0F1 ATP synthase subunit A [uncultured Tessaracoccus sp.]